MNTTPSNSESEEQSKRIRLVQDLAFFMRAQQIRDKGGISSIEADAMRYSWLRTWPDRSRQYTTSGLPWVVRLATDGGIPAIQHIYETDLDAIIDRAIRDGK